jgi:hypothetical protein
MTLRTGVVRIDQRIVRYNQHLFLNPEIAWERQFPPIETSY